MTQEYDHTKPVSEIRELYQLGQLKEALEAANALLKRTEALKARVEQTIAILEARQNER